VLTLTPVPVRDLRPGVPQALAEVVERAMSKRMADRYASCAEMADALADVFGQVEHSGKYLTPEKKFQLSRDLTFFEEFSDRELRELTDACTWQRLEPGTRIIREGNMERSCYVLVSGEVAVSKGGKRIGTLGRGSCFGEMGFLSHASPRTASIHSRGEVTLLLADVKVMSGLSPTVQLRFNQRVVSTVIDRLASTTERLSKFLDQGSD
jgi:hypothetical protein